MSMVVSPDYLLDSGEFNLSDLVPEKRKQPKRAAKGKKVKEQSKEKLLDSLPRKVLIHKGNKFYCDSQLERKLIWKCSTSRFTNCTAQLTTNLNCGKIVADGIHDHANNTE